MLIKKKNIDANNRFGVGVWGRGEKKNYILFAFVLKQHCWFALPRQYSDTEFVLTKVYV